MVPLLRQHYPYAAFALLGALLLLGDPALVIMGMALAIGGIPLAFAPEADEIARGMTGGTEQGAPDAAPDAGIADPTAPPEATAADH
jgi:hypothetical protein